MFCYSRNWIYNFPLWFLSLGQNISHFCNCIKICVSSQRVPHSKIHILFFCKSLILAVWLWCMFHSFKQCMACLSVGVCKFMPVCSDLWLEPVLSLFGIIWYNIRGCCVYGWINTGNCIMRFLYLSMPKVISFMS